MNIAIRPDNSKTEQALAGQAVAGPALAGKVSLVTGSTSGIGLGIARALAAAGSEIVLNGFGKPEEVADVQARIAEDFKVRVSYSPADMSKPQAIREMIETTLRSSGRIDVLVNNAGIQHVAPLQDFPIEKWDAILGINLSSAFHTTRLALPSMLQNKWGRIINIASAHGLVASPFKAAYVAAKHGMVGLTKVTALETAEQGITCNAICPGYVYTPLVEAQIGAKPRRMGLRANRSFATCCSRSSRTSVSQQSKSWVRLRCSLRARPRHRSRASRCRWMAVGPRTKRLLR